MGLGVKLGEAAIAGLTGATTGGIGSIISGGLGLLGGLFKRNNNGLKNQQKLMQQAWEYEKEGMGLQYNYGQQAADAEYKRNRCCNRRNRINNQWRSRTTRRSIQEKQ